MKVRRLSACDHVGTLRALLVARRHRQDASVSHDACVQRRTSLMKAYLRVNSRRVIAHLNKMVSRLGVCVSGLAVLIVAFGRYPKGVLIRRSLQTTSNTTAVRLLAFAVKIKRAYPFRGCHRNCCRRRVRFGPRHVGTLRYVASPPTLAPSDSIRTIRGINASALPHQSASHQISSRVVMWMSATPDTEVQSCQLLLVAGSQLYVCNVVAKSFPSRHR